MVDLMSSTASGAAGRSDGRGEDVPLVTYFCVWFVVQLGPTVLTCLQIPEVLAAHLVVPALAISVAAAPNVKPGADRGGAVAGPGSGPTGIWIVTLRSLVLQLGLHIIWLLGTKALPAHGVCDKKTRKLAACWPQ